MLKQNYAKKNPGTELLRIIACMIIISRHAYDTTFDSIPSTFLYMMAVGGPTCFWFITGFFIFKRTEYKQYRINSLKRVGIPAIIMLVLYYFLEPANLHFPLSFASIFNKTGADLSKLLQDILSFNPPDGCFYFWYVYTYILVLILLPFIVSFVRFLDESARRKRIFIIVTLVLFFINGLSNNELLEFSNHGISAFIPATIEIILGHFIYDYFHEKANFTYAIISFAVLVIINIFKSVLFFKYNFVNTVYWFGFFTLFAATCLTVFSMGIMKKVKVQGALHNSICFFGSITFDIYLIHVLVVRFAEDNGVFDLLHKLTFITSSTFVNTVFYKTIIVLFVFFVSAAIICVVKSIGSLIKKK